ncbi:hypothetical protein [Providencia rustigianii]
MEYAARDRFGVKPLFSIKKVTAIVFLQNLIHLKKFSI